MLWGCSTLIGQTPGHGASFPAIALGTLLLGAFVVRARHLGGRALLDVGLLKHRTFAVSSLLMFLFGFTLYGTMFVLPLYYRQVQGTPVTEVGPLLAPQGLGTMAALWLAGHWSDRIGPRPIAVCGVLMSGTGAAAFALLGDSAGLGTLFVPLILMGTGLGASGVAVTSASYRDVPREAVSSATSILNFVQRIGASCGTTVIALILASHLRSLPFGPHQNHVEAAFTHAFGWAAALAAVTLITALFLPPHEVAAGSRPPNPSREERKYARRHR